MTIPVPQVRRLVNELRRVRLAHGIRANELRDRVGVNIWEGIECPRSDPKLSELFAYADCLDTELVIAIAPEMPPGVELVQQDSDRKMYALFDFTHARHVWGWSQVRVCQWIIQGYKVTPETLIRWGLHVPKRVFDAYYRADVPGGVV